MPSTPLTMAGNSHVVHFQRAVDMGASPAPRRPVTFHAQLALSLLHPFFDDPLVARPGQDCLLFVPGFRIGNRVLLDARHPEAHHAVDGDLITPENDARMYALYLERLDELRRRNPALRLLFWSLAVGEHRAQSAGRHCDAAGTYRHPTWNLADVEHEFAEQTIPLAPLLGSAELMPALVKDSSGHPTEIAATLFHRFLEAPEAGTDAALAETRRTATVPRFDFRRPTILTGDSVWLRVLADYCARDIVRLQDTVQLVLDSREIADADDADLVYITDLDVASLDGDGRIPDGALDEIRRLGALGVRPRVISWASRANEHTNPPVVLDPGHPGHPLALDEQLATALSDVADVRRDAAHAPRSLSLRHVDIEQESGRPKPSVEGLVQLVREAGGGRGLEWWDGEMRR